LGIHSAGWNRDKGISNSCSFKKEQTEALWDPKEESRLKDCRIRERRTQRKRKLGMIDDVLQGSPQHEEDFLESLVKRAKM
jgi:hypothetical protein